MTDEPQLPEAELASLADGSLPPERRERLRAQIQASPELAAALAEQQRAVTMLRALDQPAPSALRARVQELTGETADRGRAADRRRRRRRSLFIPAATAVAVIVVALVVALGGSAGTAPTIPQTAHLALAAATQAPPREDTADRGALRLSIQGVAFPYYGSSWATTGTRTDTVAGRRIVTVFYMAQGVDRVGYSIVAGAPLKLSGGRTTTQGGVRYTLQQVGDARLVTWRRSGHTCVIAGRTVTDSTLLALAIADRRLTST